MSQQGIQPSAVTKPIQLLAAWLAGLVLIDGSFLTAASQITSPTWAGGALVAAAILNVPIFLALLFYMQTRFRPEMQEDSYYYKYLEQKAFAQTQKVEIVEQAMVEAKLPAPSRQRAKRFIRPKTQATEYQLQVNDLLENFSQIVEALDAKGLKIQETFGSTSEDKGKPTEFALTFGSRLPIKIFQSVLEISCRYGLQTLGYSSRDNDDDGDTDVYIGSYLYELPDAGLIHVTKEVKREFMRKDLTFDKIREVIRKNRK